MTDTQQPAAETSTDLSASITPVAFAPSESAGRRAGLKPWQMIMGLVLLLVAAVLWFLFTSKSVRIQLQPAPDSLRIVGGLSFELGGVYLLREGQYTLHATAALHHPLEHTFTVNAQRNQTVSLAFTPLPGFLTLQLDPADAAVSIDQLPTPLAPRLPISAGTHTVNVSHPRYLPATATVEIEGKHIEQSLTLQLAPNWSEVSIVSSPPGAQVWIDQADSTQRTPATVQALAGEREIQVRLPGYKIHRQRIFAQAGVPMALDAIELVQADAQLNLTSTPAGAGVTLSGQYVGQTPLQLDLKSGETHRLQMILSGYDTFSVSKTLPAGATELLHAELTRQTGTLVVRTQPDHAKLTINGKDYGSANQSVTLPVSAQQVAISLPGYAGYSQTITPKVGLVQEIKVKLLTLEEARLAAMKPNITTVAGQQLKLFKPYDFTQGASRREPGRRANETLRVTEMSRPFYLSTREVTNGQFRQFAAGHDAGTFAEQDLNANDMPVSSVGWHEAAAYCNWLSDQEGLPRFYDIEFGKVVGSALQSTGYRLPTEAEWAWAARTPIKPPSTPTTPVDQLRFPWGDALPPPERQGNYADRAASSLVGRIIFGYNDNHTAAAPTGSFKPDQRGLYDMGGNVAEWIHDFYEIPSTERVRDPSGPTAGEYHVIRGASWMHGTITELRWSFRDYGIQGRQDVGFRIARYAE